MNHWHCTVLLEPNSDGVVGGDWRLIITKVDDSTDLHWWSLSEATLDGPEVYQNEDGLITLVLLASNRPFEEAAREFRLDDRVFGSPTLWPRAHVEGFLGSAASTDAGTVSSRIGWTWTVSSDDPGFPFLTE